MRAANRIKSTHYAEIDPKHEGKQILALCGFRVPKGETTADKGKVDCFLCWEHLQAASQTRMED